MYRSSSCCRLPPDDTLIWRYFDFAKFVSLLDSRSLWFPSATSLEDPLEGAVPWPETARWPKSEAPWETDQASRDRVMISSWHINSEESIAMWKLYSKSVEAVAVRSTVGRLKQSLALEKDFDVYVSQVEYIDHRRDSVPECDPLALYLCKAKPYSYENEIRAIVDLRGRKGKMTEQAVRDHGLQIRVDLETLIEAIYISPLAGQWFLDLVRSVSRKFGMRIEPRHSILMEYPSSLQESGSSSDASSASGFPSGSQATR